MICNHIMSLNKKMCQGLVSNKIRKIIREGKFPTRKQSIAVAFSIVSKENPSCKRVLKRKRSTK